VRSRQQLSVDMIFSLALLCSHSSNEERLLIAIINVRANRKVALSVLL
jgi:hypothetical protein